MSRPTVLYISHGHPDIVAGGGEQYALELYQGMRDEGGFEPRLLARTGATLGGNSHIHPGTPLHGHGGDAHQHLFHTETADFDWFTATSRDHALSTRHFREFLETYRPDVVHFQHTAWLGMDFIRVARNTLPRAPIIYTLHEFLPICLNQGQMVRTRTLELCDHATPRRCAECFTDRTPTDFFLRKRLMLSHLELVDAFVAPSEQLRQRYIEWGIPGERIQLEEYGRQPVTAARTTHRDKRTRFAYFGQVTPFKGVDVLLKAAAMITPSTDGADGLHVRIHGVGVESHGEAFQRQIAALLDAAGSRASMAGRYRSQDLPRLMESVDWVVVPSIWWENSPLVIQEAFAQGRPVICSDIGGMAEKVSDGVDGIHFRVGDAASLAETMSRAQRETGLWDRLRANIRPPHAMHAHVATMTQLYQQLLAQRQPLDTSHAS